MTEVRENVGRLMMGYGLTPLDIQAVRQFVGIGDEDLRYINPIRLKRQLKAVERKMQSSGLSLEDIQDMVLKAHQDGELRPF